jgi:hypothetical protein
MCGVFPDWKRARQFSDVSDADVEAHGEMIGATSPLKSRRTRNFSEQLRQVDLPRGEGSLFDLFRRRTLIQSEYEPSRGCSECGNALPKRAQQLAQLSQTRPGSRPCARRGEPGGRAAKVEKIALGEFEHRLRVAKQEARGADVFSLGSSDPR